MQTQSPAALGARQSQRDLHDTLQHLQSIYDDVQAQLVAHTPASAASRRRATDPGSPALRGSAYGTSLRSSASGSPLRLMFPAAAPSPQRAPPQHPPQQPAAGGSPHQHRHMASSAAAVPHAAPSAVTRAPVGGSGGGTPTLMKPTQEPLDSYQQFAAQMFNERFCPLRVGLQHPGPRGEQPVRPRAAPDSAAPLARQPPLSPPAGCGQQQRTHQQQHGAQQQEQQRQHRPQQQEQQRQHRAQQQEQQQQEQQQQQQTQSQQVRLPAAHQHQQKLSEVSRCRRLEAGATARDRQEQLTPLQHPAVEAGCLAASSDGGSPLSYASEERDAVLLASPARDDAVSSALEPAEPEVHAALAARATAAVAATGQASAARRRSLPCTHSPLPHLQMALALLSDPAAACAASGADARGAPPARDVTPPPSEHSGLQQGCRGSAAAPAGLQPQRLLFDSSRPGSSDAEAQEHLGSQQAATATLGLQQEEQQQQREQQGSWQQHMDGANSCSDGPLPGPALGTTSPQVAAAAHQVTPAEPAAESRPTTAGSRAAALLRLKQRRLWQRQADEPMEDGHGMDDAPASDAMHASLPAAAGGSHAIMVPAAGNVSAGWPDGSAGRQLGVQHGMQQEHTQGRQPGQQERAGRNQQQAQRGEDGHAGRDEQRQQRGEEERAGREQQQVQRGEDDRAGRAPPDHERPSQADQGDGAQQQRPPKPFLRRRSQLVPMQRLPDWKAVRPRTNTRWESDEGGSRPGTPGGSAASTPAGSRAGTPRASGAAQQAQPQPPSRASSRLGGGDGSLAGGAVFGSHAWEAAETATYALRPSSFPPTRTTSRGAGAAAAAAGQAQRAATAGHVGGQRRPLAANREQPHAAGRPAAGSSKLGSRQGSARTTPFAPRPNSGSSRGGAAGAWRCQQQAHTKGRRPRGNPLYDASSLLPLSLDGLLHYGGPGSSALADMHSAPGSSRAYDGSSGLEAAAAASHPLQEGDALAWAARHLAGSVDSVAAAAEAVAAAPGGDCGPLDDLLLAVDRMLRQVERAID